MIEEIECITMLSYHDHSLLERNPQHTSALIGGTSHLPNLHTLEPTYSRKFVSSTGTMG